MNTIRWRAVGAAAISTAVPVLGAATIVAANDGRGTGDLPAFAFWSVLFGAFTAMIVAVLSQAPRTRRTGRWRMLLAAFGVAAGVLATLGLALAMGGMMLAWSFPVPWLWGGAAAVALTASLHDAPAPPAADARSWARVSLGLLLGSTTFLLAPFVLMIGAMYVSVMVQRTRTAETVLLPAEFRGPVLIVFDQPDGIVPPLEDGAPLFEVPPSGVLRVRTPKPDRSGGHHVYFVDASGTRLRVPGGSCGMPERDDTVMWCHGLSGRSEPRPLPAYRSYIITRPSEADSAYRRAERLIDSIVVARRR